MQVLPTVTSTTPKDFVSSVSVKGQITIPTEVRRMFRINPKDKVTVKVTAGKIEIVPQASRIDAHYQTVIPLKKALTDRETTESAWEAHAYEVANEDP